MPDLGTRSTPPAPSAADLAATVRHNGNDHNHGSVENCPRCVADALLARCQEAERERDRLRGRAYAMTEKRDAQMLRAEAAEAERDEARRIALSLGDQLTDAVDRRAAAEARVAELEAALRGCLDDLIWMSGSPSFGPEGEAHEGFKKVRDRVDGYFAALQSGGSEGGTDG